MQRIRSPILGSIALTFFCINWRPLWYLVFADQPVAVKFAFFDLNTTSSSLYIYPLVGGLALALLSPWLKWIGAWFAANPIRRLRFLQAVEAQEHKIKRLGLAAKEEEAKSLLETASSKRIIEAAKVQTSAQEVGGDALASKVVEGATRAVKAQASSKETKAKYDNDFKSLEKIVIGLLGSKGEPVHFTSALFSSPEFTGEYKKTVPNFSSHRMKGDLIEVIKSLSSRRIIVETSDGKLSLTPDGYKIFDNLSVKF